MDARTKLGWVRLYEEVGNAGVVCRRCGISRSTLRKWWRRYWPAFVLFLQPSFPKTCYKKPYRKDYMYNYKRLYK